VNIFSIFENFKLDFWTLWGIVAQGFFFFRLVIQWYSSEKAQKTIVPISFWWLGMIGACMLFIYAFARNDIVFLITAILQVIIYFRNLRIAFNQKSEYPVE
jgi:lipid-A-disaccharide synthase-like uncharacterized protein